MHNLCKTLLGSWQSFFTCKKTTYINNYIITATNIKSIIQFLKRHLNSTKSYPNMDWIKSRHKHMAPYGQLLSLNQPLWALCPASFTALLCSQQSCILFQIITFLTQIIIYPFLLNSIIFSWWRVINPS